MEKGMNGPLGKINILLKIKGYHYLGAVVCIVISQYTRWILRLRLQTVLTGFVTFHWKGLQEKPASPPQQLHSDIIILWPSLKNWISSSWNNTKQQSILWAWEHFDITITKHKASFQKKWCWFPLKVKTEIPLQSFLLKRLTEVMRIWSLLNYVKSNPDKLICLTIGTHNWNITHTYVFSYGLYRHQKHNFFFILPFFILCSRITSLTVVVLKQMVHCTPDTWFNVKLRIMLWW